MTSRKHPSTRALRSQPDLDQLKRQAKELLKAFASGDPDAIAEVRAHFHGARASTFALHDAQLVLARAYGFDSWPTLHAYVDGVTVRRLVEAVRGGDLEQVTAMLRLRPELVRIDVSEGDEHRALHHAVLTRQPAMVRLLMQHGADPRKGIWPHRDATSAIAIATDRDYSEIVAIIREEESRRVGLQNDGSREAVPPALTGAFSRGDEEAIIGFLGAQPELIRLADAADGMTPLHMAAACLWERLGTWLVEHGADVNARTRSGETPLDLIGSYCDIASSDDRQRAARIANVLLARDARPTVRSAIAAGDADWLRARHAEGLLATERGLVSHAVRSDRPDMLALLLDAGLDADERERVGGLEETVESWGGPLRDAVMLGKPEMAAMLLEHGADPNTNIYATSSAMYEAHAREDGEMVRLLERHGGALNAIATGYLGLVDRARQLLDDAAAGRPLQTGESGRGAVAQALLDGAADNGHVEIVQLALDALDWPRGDGRWNWMLMRPLGDHRPADRHRFITIFRMIADRSGADLPGSHGRTILHDIAAAWPRVPSSPEEQVAFATILLDRGARLDVRDDVLRSTPLGWACRWGRVELVELFLARGADPIEADAEPWATPRAWAEKMHRQEVLDLLQRR